MSTNGNNVIPEYEADFSLWNSLKGYEDKISIPLQEAIAKQTQANTDMKKYEKDYNKSQNVFDDKEYLENITKALVVYFSTLGAEYEVEIKERYE